MLPKSKDKKPKDKKFDKKLPKNSKTTCYYCNKKSHYSRECRSRLKYEAKDKKVGGPKLRIVGEETENGTESHQGDKLGDKIDSLKKQLDFFTTVQESNVRRIAPDEHISTLSNN